MTKNRGIQYETVAAIADGLVAQGIRPTDISGMMIREETGTGSLTTILNHLKRWSAQFKPHPAEVVLTTDNMSAITSAIETLIQTASERVRDQERKAAAAAAVEAERIRVERDEALTLNEQIEAEREAAVARIAALEAELGEVALREAALQGKLEATMSAFARLEQLCADRVSGQNRADVENAPTREARSSAPNAPAAEMSQQLAAELVAAQTRLSQATSDFAGSANIRS